jgi:mannitol/fructose-specific phosphotransferase system IIA component (Ntr-type)
LIFSIASFVAKSASNAVAVPDKETIAMDLSSSDKNGVIDELVHQLDKAGKLSDVE